MAHPNMATEPENVVHLAGTAGNPAHEPRKRSKDGKGSLGDTAFKDAVFIVILCWVLLIALAYSLRHHNV